MRRAKKGGAGKVGEIIYIIFTLGAEGDTSLAWTELVSTVPGSCCLGTRTCYLLYDDQELA